MNLSHPTKALKIVKASAGSGKTHLLTQSYLNLIFSNPYLYQKVLAVTFTNMATAEMKERIMGVLKDLTKGEKASDDGKGFMPGIMDTNDLEEEELYERARLICQNILHDYSRLNVMTIDKFFLKIIRGLTHEFEIDAHFQVEMNTEKVTDVITEQLFNDLLSEDNKHLLDWIIDIVGDKLDDGSTWDLSRNLKDFVKNIFYNDAFNDLQDDLLRVDKDVLFEGLKKKYAEEKVKMDEFIKHFLQQLVEHSKGLSFGRYAVSLMSNLERVYNSPRAVHYKTIEQTGKSFFAKIEDSEEALISYLFNKAEIELDSSQQFNSLAFQLGKEFLEVKSQFQFYAILNESSEFLNICINLSKYLADYRTKYGVILVSDATQLLYQIAKDHQDNPSFIWEKAGMRYQYFLIDEFQDTSRKQWQNFLPLIQNAISTKANNKLQNLIVGDVKQSIYRWRGGDWNLLQNQVKQDLGNLYVEEAEPLKFNYRSDGKIIAFNNALYSYLPGAMQKKLNLHIGEYLKGAEQDFWKQNNWHEMLSTIYEPASTIQLLPEVKEGRKDKGSVQVIEMEVENNRARFSQVRERIFKDVYERVYHWIYVEKKYKAADIGILMRTNNDAKDLIAYFGIQDMAIPIASAEAFNIADNVAIQFIVNVFELLKINKAFLKPDFTNKKGANPILFNVIYTYWKLKWIMDLTDNEPVFTSQYLNEISDNSVEQNLEKYLPKEFANQFETMKTWPTMELYEYLLSMMSLNDYKDFVPYLLAFREEIIKANLAYGASVEHFFKYWEEEKEKAVLPQGSKGDIISVVTVHKSKGLAYKVVILPTLASKMYSSRGHLWLETKGEVENLKKIPLELSESLFPFYPEDTAKEMMYQYVDELNTIYVATTRAKQEMVLYTIGQGKTAVNIGSYTISDFINEFIASDEKHFEYKGHLMETEEEIEEKSIKDTEPNPEKVEEGVIVMDHYPVSSQFQLAYTEKVALEEDFLHQLPAMQMGTLAHKMLEWYFKGEDAMTLIAKEKKQNYIPKWLYDKVIELYDKAVNYSPLVELRALDSTLFLEQSIINKDGEILRPDLVRIQEEENKAIVIDFKFANKRKSHLLQVETYKQLLLEMDYDEVEAYLYYGLDEPELIRI